MLETSRLWWAALGVVAAACATTQEPVPAPQAQVPVQAAPNAEPAETGAAAQAKRMQEAKALLDQAETDVQRARAKRALWMKAWENLVAARLAYAAADYAAVIPRARRASEYAQLGLEQLAYPALK